ncbi:MAG: hypothetical protein QW063_01375 [Candidatus Nanoarchaeia archaeon]
MLPPLPTLDEMLELYATQFFSAAAGFITGIIAVKGSKFLYKTISKNIEITKSDKLANLISHATIPTGLTLVLGNPAFTIGYIASAVPLSYLWYKKT